MASFLSLELVSSLFSLDKFFGNCREDQGRLTTVASADQGICKHLWRCWITFPTQTKHCMYYLLFSWSSFSRVDY